MRNHLDEEKKIIQFNANGYNSYNADVIGQAVYLNRLAVKLITTSIYYKTIWQKGKTIQIISIGIGTGEAEKWLEKELTQLGISVCISGVEPSVTMAKCASEKGFTVYETTIAKLFSMCPGLEGSYHLVISNAVKHHIPDKDFYESTNVEAKLLAPGGYTLGLTGAKGYVLDDHFPEKLVFRSNMEAPFSALVEVIQDLIGIDRKSANEIKKNMPFSFRTRHEYENIYRETGLRIIKSEIRYFPSKVSLKNYKLWIAVFALSSVQYTLQHDPEALNLFFSAFLKLLPDRTLESQRRALADMVVEKIKSSSPQIIGENYAIKDFVRYFWFARKPVIFLDNPKESVLE